MANHILLQEALRKPYNRLLFAKEVLSPVFGSAFKLASVPIEARESPTKQESDVLNKIFIYGIINLEDGTAPITCYEIMLKPNVRIEQSKIAISRYIRKLLYSGNAALVNFISPQNTAVWRFSFIAKDSILTNEGISEKVTNSKRYTYIVEVGDESTNRTLAQRLEKLSISNLKFDDLKEAFSVEKMSKAFFEEYRKHYEKFIKEIVDSNYRITVFKKNDKAIRDFVKKLLGRIIFLYFVQKKGWLGAKTTNYKDGSENFIMDLFKQSGANESFYSTWLSKLFFEALNQDVKANPKRKDDDFKMPNGNKVKIPFLNGGLFDMEEYDDKMLTFAPSLFHNSLNEDDSKHRGFLDFLNAFNFTVYEDSQDEHTIAVDPEMLGHIFENLLEDNKDKGAFYTPKAIVHYMCQESLIQYLLTNLSKEYKVYKEIGNNQFEFFGNESRNGQLSIIEEYGEKALNRIEVEEIVIYKDITGLTNEQLNKISSLLDIVKICDPAIGSGAFPVGLLQEIVAIKEVIAYKLGIELDIAVVKENIIHNSIYGVDIDKGAVDIARLRFWLSLVVDEEKPKPLPNLDYKIMQGNSLLESFSDIDLNVKIDNETELFRNEHQFSEQDINNLKKIANKYFTAGDIYEKKDLHSKVENILTKFLKDRITIRLKRAEDELNVVQNKLALLSKTKPTTPAAKKKKQESIGKIEKELKLCIQERERILILKEELLKVQKTKIYPFFLWHLWFSDVFEKGGFDIVIGNPPYRQLQKMEQEADMYESANYQTFARTGDIYCIFYEKGFNILKTNGHLSYITSNKWMRASYGVLLREYLINNSNPLILIDFSGFQVFENATVDTNILIAEKGPNKNLIEACIVEKDFKGLNNLSVYFRQNFVSTHFTTDSWVILSVIEQGIKLKIEKAGIPLKDWKINIYRGILTGYNNAFIIDNKTKDKLISDSSKNADIIRPILRGRNIQKFTAKWNHEYLITTFPSLNINIETYPLIKEHFLSFGKKRLEQTGKVYIVKNKEILARKKTNNKWYETQDQIGFWKDFTKPKIIWKRIGSVIRFAYDESEALCLDSTCFATGEDVKYLVGVLNSTICIKELLDNSPKTGTGDVIISVQALEPLLVPKPTKTEKKEIENLVDKCIEKLKQNSKADITNYEKQIDQIVFKLYGLNENEVEILSKTALYEDKLTTVFQ